MTKVTHSRIVCKLKRVDGDKESDGNDDIYDPD